MRRLDPDFDRIPVPLKADVRLDRQRRLAVLLAVLGGSIGFALLIDPELGLLGFFLVLAAGGTFVILAAALALAWLGFGLFALGDRVVGWVRRATTWPKE